MDTTSEINWWDPSTWITALEVGANVPTMNFGLDSFPSVQQDIIAPVVTDTGDAGIEAEATVKQKVQDALNGLPSEGEFVAIGVAFIVVLVLVLLILGKLEAL